MLGLLLFDSLSSKGSLLKIESKAENDYLVELLSKHLKETNSSIPGRNPQEVPWTWLGATRQSDQIGFDHDHRNNVTRIVDPLIPPGSAGEWFWLDGSQVSGFNNGLTNPSTDNYSVLNWETGAWEDVPLMADPLGNPLPIELKLPYVLEKELNDLAMDWRPIPADLKGVRKVLVVPARISSMETLETDNYSRRRF